MPSRKTLDYLSKKEYSMGNGQCHECGGLKPNIFTRYSKGSHGHKRGCGFARVISEAGASVVYRKEVHVFLKRPIYRMYGGRKEYLSLVERESKKFVDAFIPLMGENNGPRNSSSIRKTS